MSILFRSLLLIIALALPARSQQIDTSYKNIFNIKTYGAACDGVTDDTAAWIATVAALNAAGGGTIQVPSCTTLTYPGVIVLPTYSALIGQGLNSVIKWNGPQLYGSFLVSASGTNSSAISGYITIENIQLSGSNGSPLLRMWYSAHNVVHNVWGNGGWNGFLDAVQLWDSRFTDIQCDYCGVATGLDGVVVASGSGTNLTVASVTSGGIDIGDLIVGTGITGSVSIIRQTSGTPGGTGVYVTSSSTTASGATVTVYSPPITFRIRNSAAVSGAGFGSDNSNQDYFVNIRTEGFYGSAFRIEQGPNNTQTPNGIYVVNFKGETPNITSYPLFVVGAGTDASSFSNIYLSADNWSSGSTAVDEIDDFGNGNNIFNGLFLSMPTAAAIVASPVNVNPTGSSPDSISNVVFTSGNGPPTINAVINESGGTSPIINGFVTNNVSIAPVTGGFGNIVGLSSPPGSFSLTNTLFCDSVACGTTQPFSLNTYTVSTLPVSGLPAAMVAVTDAVACVSGSTPTGSGSVKCPLYWNGSAWVH